MIRNLKFGEKIITSQRLRRSSIRQRFFWEVIKRPLVEVRVIGIRTLKNGHVDEGTFVADSHLRGYLVVESMGRKPFLIPYYQIDADNNEIRPELPPVLSDEGESEILPSFSDTGNVSPGSGGDGGFGGDLLPF